MSRNKKNIKIELNERLNSLLQIGQKKVREEPGGEYYNPNRTTGIHSIKTADTYRRVINQLGEYCKSQGVKDVSDINHETIAGFMESRSGESSWTASKDLSAINKVLGTHYSAKEFGYGSRTQESVVHNRGILTGNSSRNAARNQTALHFVRATGCSRASILRVTPVQAIRDGSSGLVIGFTFREHGGKVRNALVLPSERKWVTELVCICINERGVNGTLVTTCDSHCNPQLDRGIYAHEMYAAMLAARNSGNDIYLGHRTEFVNEKKSEKANMQYKGELAKGYDKHICAELAQQMGVNRIDAVIAYLENACD